MTIETVTKGMALESLLKDIPTLTESLRDLRETYLTDAVFLGEIPAPTFGEENRVRLALDRFRKMAWMIRKLMNLGTLQGYYRGLREPHPFS